MDGSTITPILLLLLLTCTSTRSKAVDSAIVDVIDNEELKQFEPPIGPPVPPIRHCPKCDSSVFSYCSDRLFHDSCCCSPPYDLPFQCQYADCGFLHSNSCREHFLIAQCCCTNYLFK